MATRTRLGSIYLALSQKRIVQSLRKMPLLGSVMHCTSHLLLPWNTRTWVEVEGGFGRGLKLRLNPRYDQHYWHGDCEEDTQAVIANNLRPRAIVYDVGANIGFFALLAARVVGSDGVVFAFEADPDNASRLLENVEANSFKNVSVVMAPVWSSNTRVFFARSSDHSSRFIGSVRIPEEGVDGFYEDAITLDDFSSDHAAPDFIKMDIEGGETEALVGASKLFESKRPLLLLEVHNKKAEEFVRDWLRDKRYVYEWLGGGPSKLPCHMMARPESRA